MTGGRLTISYADNSSSLNYNPTNGSVEPQEAAVIQKAFVLTGANTTDLKMPYVVNMVVVNNEFSNNALTYVLTNDTVNNGTITLENSGRGSIPGPQVTFTGQTETDYTSATKGAAVTNQTIKLAEGNFTKTEGATHQYKLSIFFGTDYSNLTTIFFCKTNCIASATWFSIITNYNYARIFYHIFVSLVHAISSIMVL